MNDAKARHLRKFVKELFEEQLSLENWVEDTELIEEEVPDPTAVIESNNRKVSVFSSFGALLPTAKKVTATKKV